MQDDKERKNQDTVIMRAEAGAKTTEGPTATNRALLRSHVLSRYGAFKAMHAFVLGDLKWDRIRA